MKRILKRILQLVNLLIALALILAYLSTHISPEVIWSLSFFGLAYPYLLFINFLFVVFWLFRRNKTFFLSLVVILVGFNHVKSFIRIPLKNERIESPAASLNVMTYNVRLFNHYNWSDEKMMHSKITQFINARESDLVCLQELFINESASPTEKELLAELSQLKYAHIHYHNMSPQKKFGIATLSHFPIINKGSLQFRGSLNLTIYSDIKIGNDTIRVYNSHLQSFKIQDHDIAFINDLKLEYNEKQISDVKALSKKLGNAFVERAQQVDFVAEHIHNSPYPVIVCGDFNDTPVSYAYNKMRGKLKDSFTEAGSGTSKTYTGKAPSYRIDYILHSKQLKAADYKRHKVRFSDHFPVTTRILIPKTEGSQDQDSLRTK